MLKRLSTEARQNEVDKYKLHVDEVDKITSLLLGLSSRLARSEISLINLKKNCNEEKKGTYFCLKDGRCVGNECIGCVRHKCDIDGKRCVN